MIEILAWASLFIGLVARVFVPFLSKRRNNPDPVLWNFKKYVLPQLLSLGLVILVLPLIITELSSMGEVPYQAAWLVGWGAGDVGRKTYKALSDEEW